MKKKNFIIENGKLLKVEIELAYNRGEAERELAVIDQEIAELESKAKTIKEYLKQFKKDETNGVF